MSDSSTSYIHMLAYTSTNFTGYRPPPINKTYQVQHLIEKCLIFKMTKEECMEALSKHANIQPVITATVWKELEKENKEFFETYSQSQKKDHGMTEEETSAMIQKMIVSDHSKESDGVGASKESDDE